MRQTAQSLILLAAASACATAGLSATAHDAQHTPNDARLAASSATVIDHITPSLALDRITKRRPVLDGIVRHTGTGRGVAIYVFDGGIAADHPELAGRVRFGFDAFPSAEHVCNAHGTAVAGAAAGATLGVAPRAEIIDVKIIDCKNHRGTVEAITQAARWTIEDHRWHAGQPAIANWSFIVDTTKRVPAVDSAIAMLHDAGILVVVSAGNVEMDACKVSPANSHQALVVGASAIKHEDQSKAWDDIRSRETAFGKCVDLYAPGDSVLLPSFDRGISTTMLWNGTSMAAGYVSGAAAVYLEANPFASPATVSKALIDGATHGAVDERLARPQHRAPLLYVGMRH